MLMWFQLIIISITAGVCRVLPDGELRLPSAEDGGEQADAERQQRDGGGRLQPRAGPGLAHGLPGTAPHGCVPTEAGGGTYVHVLVSCGTSKVEPLLCVQRNLS